MISDSRLANLGAKAIGDAFESYQCQFKVITQRAKTRFETRDWRGIQTDAGERLDLYKKVIDQIEALCNIICPFSCHPCLARYAMIHFLSLLLLFVACCAAPLGAAMKRFVFFDLIFLELKVGQCTC